MLSAHSVCSLQKTVHFKTFETCNSKSCSCVTNYPESRLDVKIKANTEEEPFQGEVRQLLVLGAGGALLPFILNMRVSQK